MQNHPKWYVLTTAIHISSSTVCRQELSIHPPVQALPKGQGTLPLAAAQHTLIPRSLHSAWQNARTAALIIRILQKRTFSQPETIAEKEMDKGMAMMVISIVTGIIAAVLVHMQEKESRSKLKQYKITSKPLQIKR